MGVSVSVGRVDGMDDGARAQRTKGKGCGRNVGGIHAGTCPALPMGMGLPHESSMDKIAGFSIKDLPPIQTGIRDDMYC